MNKKRLPKAIRPAVDDIGEDCRPDRRQATPQQVRAHSTDSDALIESEITRPDSGRAGNGVGTAPTPQTPPPPVAQAVVRATPTTSEFDAERRRLLAYAIVERHAAYSAVGGIVPLPIVNLASITAIIVRMVKELSEIYGVLIRARSRACDRHRIDGGRHAHRPIRSHRVYARLHYAGRQPNWSCRLFGCRLCVYAQHWASLIERFESGATLHQFAAPDRTATS